MAINTSDMDINLNEYCVLHGTQYYNNTYLNIKIDNIKYYLQVLHSHCCVVVFSFFVTVICDL